MSCVSIDPSAGALENQLRELAKQIAADVAELDPDNSRALLGSFVSELVLSVAEQSNRQDRRQRQAQGIAAAKARGVRFGRSARPLPDNFDEIHRAWRGGELTLSQASAACDMPRGTFYNIAVRRERAEDCTG